jgi:hypothetical protein
VVLQNGRPVVLAFEGFRNLTMDKTSPNYAVSVLEESTFVDGVDKGLGQAPAGSQGSATGGPANEDAWKPPTGGPLTRPPQPTLPIDVQSDLRPANSSGSTMSRRSCMLVALSQFNA